ncbi:hypothetical protein BpHYR1_044657 [Brachionus plicatilis]|uniref:Uncharacterized protein n=1 Tax=Brachionus plicatilis TaxID=10195 RepID=A0A3M7T6L2_BRAPC|nr:hypothetical protein BpHYR1_044657 [Brachionus plicatilis]
MVNVQFIEFFFRIIVSCSFSEIYIKSIIYLNLIDALFFSICYMRKIILGKKGETKNVNLCNISLSNTFCVLVTIKVLIARVVKAALRFSI